MAYIQERRTENGDVKYRVQIRLKGYPVTSATFKRKTDAKKWAQKTEAAMQEGRYFKTLEATKHTVAELVDRYIENIIPNKPKNAEGCTAQLKWWKNEIGHCLLSDLTPALIAEKRDKLLRGITYKGKVRSPATVVRYLAALSHAITMAIKEWGWLEDSPMRKVTKPTEPRGRVRFLNDVEKEVLLTTCKESSNPYLYIVVVLALSTGMRQGEIMNLCWEDVNLDVGRIILTETKNGDRRVVSLRGQALSLLRKFKEKCEKDFGLLFPSLKTKKPIDLRFSWNQALKKAGIKDFRFHDCRHSAASYLAMSGATPSEIAEVLGHRNFNMVKKYAHLSEQHSAKVVEKMNEKFLME